MRLNAANRSFFALIATALIPYALLGLFGCGVLSLVAYRLGTDGWGGLTTGGQDLRPAVAFFIVVAAGTLIGGSSAVRQVAATRALTADVARRAVSAPMQVEDAATHAGLAGRIDVVADDQPYSFTYGLTAPRVVVSTGLIDAVAPDELEAVLHHERYHVRSGDTLKSVVARAASSAFFFLPALQHLRDRYLNGRELAADRAAVRATGDRALAGALSKVLDGPAWTDIHTAAALGGGVLDHRIEQLEEGQEPALPRVPTAARWMTAGALAVLVGLFALTVACAGADALAMDGSMPSSGGGAAMTIAGGVACTAAMAAAAVLAIGGGRRHRRAR